MSTTTQKNTLRSNIAQQIKQSQLVAIIRLKQQSDVANVLECLIEGGITSLEITANTPGFCEEIKNARQKYPDALIGAGTVVNASLAKQAIDAGAQFLVTPNTEKSVIEVAHAHGVPVLMGALTPTDIANCINYNADFIKIFPAGSFGIKYFKDLQGPFSGVPLMPVGGVNIDNITDWFEAGAVGVGVASDLCRPTNTAQEREKLIALARNYVSKLPNNN